MNELETAKQRIRDLETQLDGLARSDMRYCKKAGELQVENKRLRDALKKHKHTDKCFTYAAKTTRQSGNYYCIAECADSHRQALQEKSK